MLMDRTSNEFLSGTAFTQNQHSGVLGRHSLGDLQQPSHRGTAPDNSECIRRELFVESCVLLPECLDLPCVLECDGGQRRNGTQNFEKHVQIRKMVERETCNDG